MQQLVLTVMNGDERGRIVVCEPVSRLVVGRGEDADVQLSPSDQSLRRHHVSLEPTISGWLMCEVPPAKNTPRINGVVRDRVILVDGDLLQLGNTRLGVSAMSGTVPNGRCRQCGVDLSSVANADGRFLDLRDAATYLCPAHVERSPEFVGKRIGTYEICSRLGEGGAGVVFCGYDPRTARLVAVKRLGELKVIEQIRRFDLEMSELKELRHNNIIRFVDSGVDDDGIPYLVTEYAPDGDLAGLTERAKIDVIHVAMAIDLFTGVLDGVAFLHSRADVHRDLKPQNILLRSDGHARSRSIRYTPKIADFGLVKRLRGVRITRPTYASGTLGYMPPEQASNFSGVDGRADIYAIGASLYFVLTGTTPVEFPDDIDDGERLRRVMHSDRVPVLKRNSRVKASLAAVVDKACHRDPQQRFQTAAEFQDALVRAKEAGL